jgi:hypothetical protein
MEMVGKQFSHLWNCSGLVLKKAVLTVYGNGWQAVLPFMELLWASSQESSSHRLWKWLASSSPIYGTALG